MKRLIILALALMLLCGCAESVVNGSAGRDVSNPTAAKEAAGNTADPEPADNTGIGNDDGEAEAPEEGITRQWWEGLSEAPDGKEVTIFADNTIDFDYSGCKEIGYEFDDLHLSVMVPEGWNAFRYYPSCDCEWPPFENGLTGIPIYNGELPVKLRDMPPFDDNSYKFANDPMQKSTFFLAFSPWLHPQDLIDRHITKFDHETYTDKNDRTMQVYFLNGLPKYICYDDFFFLCIWLNLKSEDEIPTVVSIVNSIEASLSNDAESALNTAKRLGYTIIPPEE